MGQLDLPQAKGSDAAQHGTGADNPANHFINHAVSEAWGKTAHESDKQNNTNFKTGSSDASRQKMTLHPGAAETMHGTLDMKTGEVLNHLPEKSDRSENGFSKATGSAGSESGFINPIEGARMAQSMEAHDHVPTKEERDATVKALQGTDSGLDDKTKTAVDTVEKSIINGDPKALGEAIKGLDLSDPAKVKQFVDALDRALGAGETGLHATVVDGKIVLTGGTMATRNGDGTLSYPAGVSIDPKDGTVVGGDVSLSMGPNRFEFKASKDADPAKALGWLGNWAVNERHFRATFDPSTIKVDPTVDY